MRADHGSYFITMYMETETTGEKREKKGKGKEKKDKIMRHLMLNTRQSSNALSKEESTTIEFEK